MGRLNEPSLLRWSALAVRPLVVYAFLEVRVMGDLRMMRVLFCVVIGLAACGEDDAAPAGGAPGADADDRDARGGRDGMDNPDPSDATNDADDDAGPPAVADGDDGVDPGSDGGTCEPTGTPCDAADVATACAGATLYVCSRGTDGCPQATTTDCATSGSTCETGADGVAACQPTDPDGCPPSSCSSGSACEDDTLVTCQEDANGCWIENERRDCAASGAACVVDASGATASCVPASGPSCAASLGTIACGETVRGNTADGSRALDTNRCILDEGDTGIYYAGGEVIWRVVAPDSPALVQIEADSNRSFLDFDLMVLDGSGGCGLTAACVDGSYSFDNLESVEIATTGGEAFWVVYDLYDDVGEFANYTISVTCTSLVCGDGVIAPGERCDDGNEESGDGCSSTCSIESGWTCATVDGTSVCRRLNVCGDGRIDSAEACDDGNDESADGCSSTCQFEEGFTCEPGAPTVCLPTGCGDGVIQAELGEECDDRNEEDGDGCSSVCLVEPDWICEGRPSDCYIPGCGDGRLQPELGETCDDGNEEGSDGCSPFCEVEDGYFCFGAPSRCRTVVPFPAEGEIVQISGALTPTSARLNRPSTTCMATTTSVAYEVVAFVNDTDAPITVDVIALWTAFDGYMAVYDRFPEPATPTEGCLVANDDLFSTARSGFLDATVPAGAVRYYLLSGLGSAGLGAYEFTVSRPLPAEETIVLSLGEPAAAVSTTGRLSSASRLFERPTSTCGTRSGEVPLQEIEVRNPGPDAVRVDIVATFESFDGFLHVYSEPVDVANPTTGCVIGNDDGRGGIYSSNIDNFSIRGGASVWLAVSRFSGTAAGRFSVEVTPR
jgi:cysteine-rich repeat protein